MIISRCCKKPVYILLDTYICDNCNLWCYAVDISVKTQQKESANEPRNCGKTEKIVNVA